MFKLKEILEERDIPQKVFAADLGMATSTLNNYAMERRQPDFDTLVRICDALGVTADYILGRSSNPAPAISDEDAERLQAYHKLPLEIRLIVDQALGPYMKEKEADQAI